MCSMSWMIYSLQGHPGFSSKEEAIKELALDMYAKYKDDVAEDNVFNEEAFQNYIFSLHCTTTDSYGDGEDTSTRRLVWWAFWGEDILKANREEVLCLEEEAEVQLLNALYEEHPELKKENEHV